MRRSSVLGMRTIRRRLTRFVLTAIGIALGVGVFFAVLVTNATIDAGLDRILGRHQVPNIRMEAAAGFAADLPLAVIDRAARLPDVVDVSGWTGVNMRIPGAAAEEDSVFLYGGVERDGSAPAPPPEPQRGSDIITEGRAPAEGKDEIGLSDGARRQLHVGRGGSVELVGPSGPVRMVVVQFNKRRDGRPYDRRVGWTSYDTARRLGGQTEGLINDGNIRLAKGTDPSTWIARHADALPESRLVSADVDDATLREAFEGPKAALAGLAGVALFVSGFLIFLTLSMSVAESAAIHGTLRAIGASRRQVRRVVLTDAVALTVLAAPVGIGVGLLAAVGMITVTRGIYDLPSLPVSVPPFGAAVAVIVGVAVTLVSALVPAQRAATVPPVVAIRGAESERPGGRRLPLIGLALLVVGLALVFLARRPRVDVGSFVVLVGAVLIVPAVMPTLTRVAGAVTRRLARGVGTVGVLHLRKEPRRAAYTVALLMVVLSMVFTAGAVHLSLRRNLVGTLSQRFPADLVVSAGATFDDALRQRVVTTPGIRATTDLRFTRLLVQRPAIGFAFTTVLDPATFFRVQSVPWADGSDGAVRAAFERGGAVAVPASFTERHGVRRGDRITLGTPKGPRTFRVAGVYKTFDSQSPLLASVVDRSTLLAETSSIGSGGEYSRPGVMAVAVESGRSPAVVKRAIEQRFRGRVAGLRATHQRPEGRVHRGPDGLLQHRLRVRADCPGDGDARRDQYPGHGRTATAPRDRDPPRRRHRAPPAAADGDGRGGDDRAGRPGPGRAPRPAALGDGAADGHPSHRHHGRLPVPVGDVRGGGRVRRRSWRS